MIVNRRMAFCLLATAFLAVSVPALQAAGVRVTETASGVGPANAPDLANALNLGPPQNGRNWGTWIGAVRAS